jgi:anti-sigma factor RsiW
MNLTHLHLMLNHAPILGTLFGLGLLGFGLWRKSMDNQKAALGILVLAALLAVPVFLTGEPAEDAVENLPGVSRPTIEAHEEAATWAFVGTGLVGVSALGGADRLSPRQTAVLGTSLLVGGLMAWTANLGGQVRHSEIRANASIPAPNPAGDHE